MEVHHVHLPKEKKLFKEYLFEFLMLFLAVFLGFIAENIRENLSDRKKEKEYVNSLIEDIKNDTTELNAVIKQIGERNEGIDTLMQLLKDSAGAFHSKSLFNLLINLGFRDFVYNDGTIQQLKFSGGLRAIKSIEVSDSIVAYDAAARNALIIDNLLNGIISSVIDFQNKLLDFSKVPGWEQGQSYKELKPPSTPISFLTKKREDLLEYYNRIGDYKRFALGFKKTLIDLEFKGISLIHFLQKHYHLKKEN